MVLKTFSVQEEVYSKFSNFCKERGINMSKQVEMIMASVAEEDPEVKKEYLEKLDKIRKGKFHKFSSMAELRKSIENA